MMSLGKNETESKEDISFDQEETKTKEIIPHYSTHGYL